TPMWLAEGFADYVGYKTSGLSVKFIAQELAEDVQKGTKPDALPSDSDFDTNNAQLPQAYEMAWLAFRMIVAEHGEATLVRFVRAAGAPAGSSASVEQAFAAVLGTTLADFTVDWRHYVDETLS